MQVHAICQRIQQLKTIQKFYWKQSTKKLLNAIFFFKTAVYVLSPHSSCSLSIQTPIVHGFGWIKIN